MVIDESTLQSYVNLPWSYRLEWWEEQGGYYVIYVEELPGCMSDGKTVEEAHKNIREALEAYILGELKVGNSIPEPIRASDFRGQISYRTRASKHYRLAREAQRRGISINKLIDEAVDDKLAS